MDTSKNTKTWNVTFWILQSLLAVFFIMAGVSKFATSVEQQRAQMEWAKHVSDGLIYFTGIMEILGAIGLLLPGLLKIKPVLTPIAALGLAIIMILAGCLNIYIGETKGAIVFVFAALAIFIAWGRFKKAPLAKSNL